MKVSILALVAAIGFFSAGIAQAGTAEAMTTTATATTLATASASASASTTATVISLADGASGCSFEMVSPTFPLYPWSDRVSHADVAITCPAGTAWALSVSAGENAVGETRRVKNGNKYRSLRIFKDEARTQEVTVSAKIFATGTGTGVAQAFTPIFEIGPGSIFDYFSGSVYSGTAQWVLEAYLPGTVASGTRSGAITGHAVHQ